ncbi:hypothetical protein T01_10484 [Trichinella spiralis]|uniref:Uncharacterized protein n=1 Tax=Trichinella spiralis TaxID=6334 RepID=A0A0V1BUN9_TRISP|nr:hypothetical protein T01_10484 [Trichinella spiralis]
MYLNYYCIIFAAFSTINFTTSMIPLGASSPLCQTVHIIMQICESEEKLKKLYLNGTKLNHLAISKNYLKLKMVNEQKLLQSTVCMPCTVKYLYFDPKKVTVKCARKSSALAAFQTVNIPVVKASTMREEVAIETQNTITKILLEWDKQHASGVFHKLVKVEGAQTVGIITAYDITLVKKFCKVQAKYADVNDSSKVVSSPVKSPVQSTFLLIKLVEGHFISSSRKYYPELCRLIPTY